MNGLSSLLRFEYVKMRARRLTWVPFLVLTATALLIVAVFHHLQFTHAMAVFNSFNLNFSNKRDFVNGYYLSAVAMKPAFELLIPIFISVAAGLSVAGEMELGTLRASLIRPISRRNLLLSKFSLLAVYALVLSCFYLVLINVAGLAFFGEGNLYTINILFHNGEDGYSVVPLSEAPMRFGLACLFATMGMMVLSALALCVSALVETAAMAYVVTLSIYFTVLTLRSLPFLDWLYPYLFVTHMLRWEQCFSSHLPVGSLSLSCVHLAAYLVVFLAGAILLFEEKDIQS